MKSKRLVKRTLWTRFRSSITGLFVSKAKAQSDPDHTYGQKVEKKSTQNPELD